MKKQKYRAVGTYAISNQNVVESDKIDILNTYTLS
jgi:hypothetical protein